MAEFAQLQGEPILQGTEVPSKAGAHEAASQVFGMVSKAAFKQAESVQADHSIAMLLNANAQASSVANDALIRMKTDPSQHEQILKDTEASFNEIKKTRLNPLDRQKLNYIINGSQEKLKMHSADIGIQQNRLQNNMNFYSAYNENMSEFSHALSTGDQKQADIIQNSLLQSAKNAALDQAISPQAFQKIHDSIIAMHDRALQLHEAFGSEDLDAQKVNQANYDIFSDDNTGLSTLPSNHATNLVASHHLDIADDASISKQIYSGHLTPSINENILNSKQEKYKKYFQMIQGSVQAHSMIQSNGSAVEINKRINELNNNHDLDTAESAELHVLNNFVNSIDNGDFLSSINNTVMGSKATQQWIEEKAAIQNHVSYVLTNEGQAEDIATKENAADNKYMQNLAATANGMHIDPNKMRVILPNIMNDISSSFTTGGDPNQAINQVSRLDKNLIGYMANQTGDPIQKEVMYGIGLGHYNNMKPQFMQDVIAANQAGRSSDFTVLKGEDKISDATILTMIKSNTPDIINQLTISGGSKAASRVSGFTQAALNYVKYQALQSGDLNISDAKKYVKEFSEQMGTAYNISNRSHGLFNLSQTQISRANQDILQAFAISKATQTFLGSDEDNLENKAGLFKTDFNVYINETNHLIVKDNSGNTFYDVPYSDELLNTAKNRFKMTEEQQLMQYRRYF